MNYHFDIEKLIPTPRQRPEVMEDEGPGENQPRPENHAGTRHDFMAMTSEFMDYCKGKPTSRIGLFSGDKYAKACFILTHPKPRSLKVAKGASEEEFRQYAYLRQNIQENYVVSGHKLLRKVKRGRKMLQVATVANALGFIIMIHEDLAGAKARGTFSVINERNFGITREDVE